MAANSLLNGSTPSSQEHRQQHNYGSIRDPQSSRVDNHSEGEPLDTSGYGARSRSSTRGSTARHSVLIAVPEDEEIPEEDEDEYDDNASCDENACYDDSASCSSRSMCSTSSSCLSIESLSHGEGDPCHSLSKPGDGEADEEAGSRQLFWTYVALAPVLLFIWSLFVGVLWLLPSSEYETIVAWSYFGVGVLGWIFTFVSRTPIFAFFEKTLYMDEYHCEWATLFTAGTVEEVLRWVILMLLGIGGDFEAVYSLGLGWSGIETVYYVGQSLFYTWWFADDDYRPVTTVSGRGSTLAPPTAGSATHRTGNKRAKGVQNRLQDEIVSTKEARHMLGIDRPWWSLMGRTSSMMVHIGLSCWLGYYGWILLIPAALVHGTLYVVWGSLMPNNWSVPATSYGTMMVGMAIFLIGLALYGEIV